MEFSRIFHKFTLCGIVNIFRKRGQSPLFCRFKQDSRPEHRSMFTSCEFVDMLGIQGKNIATAKKGS